MVSVRDDGFGVGRRDLWYCTYRYSEVAAESQLYLAHTPTPGFPRFQGSLEPVVQQARRKTAMTGLRLGFSGLQKDGINASEITFTLFMNVSTLRSRGEVVDKLPNEVSMGSSAIGESDRSEERRVGKECPV